VIGPDQLPTPPGLPVAIWHHRPDGRARATALTEAASRLPHRALARLIAAGVLGDTEAKVTVEHVVTLPPDTRLLPAGHTPLDLDQEALEEAGEQAPEVADPATGTVRVLSRRCETCIYRRSMRELLGESVSSLIREARESGGFVICHESLPAWHCDDTGIPPSICHGYAIEFPDTFALRAARALGRIHLIDPASAEHGHAGGAPES
jgi:hypothetical protein